MTKSSVVILLSLSLSACAPRYTIHQVRDYDEAITIAEKRGFNVADRKAHLSDMLTTYFNHPKEEKNTSTSVGFMMPLPSLDNNQPMPLSPAQYHAAVTGH